MSVSTSRRHGPAKGGAGAGEGQRPLLSPSVLTLPASPRPDWPVAMPSPSEPDEPLLRPREVAALFGVRPTTIARWARMGRLQPLLTPGGHRRYCASDLRELLGQEEFSPAQQQFEQDAVRLYEQGWNIRQVAQRFGSTYGSMRRILARNTTLRPRGRPERPRPSVKHHPSTDSPNDLAG